MRCRPCHRDRFASDPGERDPKIRRAGARNIVFRRVRPDRVACGLILAAKQVLDRLAKLTLKAESASEAWFINARSDCTQRLTENARAPGQFAPTDLWYHSRTACYAPGIVEP
jgi:hypothetical protein